ncbi:hypothetical protein GNI_178090, partial [Gregarina niphandrodes]
MRTFAAVQSVGGVELLAALVTSEGLQPELDDQTSARFLTFAVKGEGQVHAVALGSEVELQELDAKLEASDLDQRKLVFESISRLKVFHVPEQTAAYTESAVRNSLKKFLDEETVETETRHQIWVDAFGKCQSETESEIVAEDTGNDELQVFTRKLKRKELEHLLPKVPEEWWEGMQRSAVSSWTEWLNLDAVRDGLKRCPSQTKLALAGGALLGVVGCYLNFLPAGADGASSGSTSTALAEFLPCVNETNLEGAKCLDGVPLCVTNAAHPEKGCALFGATFDLSTLEQLTSSGMYNVCRTSDSCVVTDTKTKTNTTLTTGKTTKTNTTLTTGKTTKSKIRKLTIGNMKDIRWCADELDQEEALCVEGFALCVLDTAKPEKKCQRKSWSGAENMRKRLSKFISRHRRVDFCRVKGGCTIPPCVRETNLRHTHCVKGVPYCLTSKSDPKKRCFLMGTQLKFEDISWFRGQSNSPFKVCRASGKCKAERPVTCDFPWPKVLSRVEAPVEECVGTDMSYGGEPVDFPE